MEGGWKNLGLVGLKKWNCPWENFGSSKFVYERWVMMCQNMVELSAVDSNEMGRY